jgi:HD superfamily phosphodiesterase
MEIKQKAIDKMKELFGTDQRRINHALKVLDFSERIMRGEGLDETGKEIVVLTAILHDIGIHEAERKYNSNSGKYQEIEGPPIAREIMEDIDVDNETIERVCYIIGGHHTRSKVDGIDFQIIWEADLLVNIEEDGLAGSIGDLTPVIEKNFLTATGKKIAYDLYIN